MISLETTSDIELLKELISTLSGGKNEEMDERFSVLEESQISVLKNIVEISKDIGEIKDSLDRVEKLFEKKEVEVDMKIEDLIKTIPENNEVKEEKTIKRTRLRLEDDFIPYSNSQEDYQKITLKGINIVHTFINRNKERDALLPINIFELLSIIERFKKNGDSLKLKEVNSFCKMFRLTKPQFSKIYYNLLNGKFDQIISQVDKMIGRSLFTFEKSFIYRNEHNTNVDIKTFKELVSIYANDPYPLCAACKIIHEQKDIDPFDLFIILRKSAVVSKIIEE